MIVVISKNWQKRRWNEALGSLESILNQKEAKEENSGLLALWS